jgi:hypothetical protein
MCNGGPIADLGPHQEAMPQKTLRQVKEEMRRLPKVDGAARLEDIKTWTDG